MLGAWASAEEARRLVSGDAIARALLREFGEDPWDPGALRRYRRHHEKRSEPMNLGPRLDRLLGALEVVRAREDRLRRLENVEPERRQNLEDRNHARGAALLRELARALAPGNISHRAFLELGLSRAHAEALRTLRGNRLASRAAIRRGVSLECAETCPAGEEARGVGENHDCQRLPWADTDGDPHQECRCACHATARDPSTWDEIRGRLLERLSRPDMTHAWAEGDLQDAVREGFRRAGEDSRLRLAQARLDAGALTPQEAREALLGFRDGLPVDMADVVQRGVFGISERGTRPPDPFPGLGSPGPVADPAAMLVDRVCPNCGGEVRRGQECSACRGDGWAT